MNFIAFLPARVKDKQPWFWDMKKIMLNRPNVSKIGVGNNSTGYDTSILQGEAGESTPVNDTPQAGDEGTDGRPYDDIPQDNTSEGLTTSSDGFWGSGGNDTEGDDEDGEGETDAEGEYNIPQRKRKAQDTPAIAAI